MKIELSMTYLQLENRAHALTAKLFIVAIFIRQHVDHLIRILLLHLRQQGSAKALPSVFRSHIKLTDIDSKEVVLNLISFYAEVLGQISPMRY